METRRPWMALLATLLVGVAATVGDPSAASPTAPPPPIDDPWAALQLEPQLDAQAAAEPLPLQRSAAPQAGESAAQTAPTTTSTGLRTAGALAAVIALIVLLAWGYRVTIASGGGWRLPFKGRQPGLVEVVSRTVLSPRQSLCLVRIGPRLVLLGVSHDNVRALDVVSDPDLTAQLLGTAARQKPDSQSAAFSQCLESEASSYVVADESADVDETILPEEERVSAVRRQITETLQRLRGRAMTA
jgi:flagellar biogenesis protein FliO